MLYYEGIFFENEMVDLIHSYELERLEKSNEVLHCTFKYKPNNDEIFNEIVGKEYEIYIIGYGCDGKNSGFQVELPNELKKYYINYDNELGKLKVPHITSSLSQNASSVDTKNLKFNPLKKPIKLIGKFGYCIKDNNNETISYEPYYKK